MTESAAPTQVVSKAGGFLKRKVFGIPVLYLAAVFVAILALYAWRTKSSAEAVEGAEDIVTDDSEYVEGAVAAGNLYPLSPTGTVYAQSPQAVVDNVEYFGNDDWMRKAVADLVSKGENPGTAQNALQAYLEGEDLSYAQGLIRDAAIKAHGLPPENFRAGSSADKPVKPTPAPAPKPEPVKPVVKPEPAPPKPVVKPAPKPQRTHKVVRNDTLWDLAQKYYGNASRWTEIASKNGIRNPKTLQIGKVLVIP